MRIRPRLFWITLALTAMLALTTLALRLGNGAAPDPPEGDPPPATPSEPAESLPVATPSALPAWPDEDGPAAPVIFVEAVAQDADTFNPVLTTNPTSLAVARKIFPALLELDAQSGLPFPTALVETWAPSPDGRSYTFTLRGDMAWSDGQPVTAWDVQFTFAALTSEAVQSPYRAALASMEQVVVINDQTLMVTFQQTDCSLLHRLRHPLLPSHRYAVDFGDLRDNPLNLAPTVNAGPFRFDEWRPGDAIRLVRSPDARDEGAPPVDEWHYRIQPDAALQVAELLAGQLHAASVPADLVAMVTGDERVVLHQVPGDSFSFLALNLADPQAPQAGQDAAGRLVAQTPHPVLGDPWVRRAVALALDTAPLLAIAYGEQSYRLPSYVLPTVDWAYDQSLTPLPHAPAEAAALLDEAGWVMGADGIRMRGGEPLALTLITNDDNAARVQMGVLAQQQLAQAGIAVEFSPLPFEAMAASLLGQQFDLALAGWEQIGPDPAASTFWHSRDDRPGVGLNVVSFQDAEVDRWLDEAAAWPGCAPEPRGERYRLAQQRLYTETPFVVLGGPLVTWAYDARWQHLTPGPWGRE